MKKNKWIPVVLWAMAASALMAEPAKTAGSSRNAELQQAIRQGDLHSMKALLDSGAEANSVDSEGIPAIMTAAIYGSVQHLRLLVEHGANVNAKSPGGATALIYAAGDAEKARLLVAAGADVNAQSLAGRTPLLVAATAANGASTVRLLLEKGAKVDTRDNIASIPIVPSGGGKATPLIEAARAGDVQTIRQLLEAGTDLDARDGKGATALTEAALYGRRDIVKELLSNKASTDAVVSSLKFPLLSMAAMRGDVEIVRMLVKAGAKVDVSDLSGATPLMWAANNDRPNPGLVHFLLKSGADVKARNRNGESALDWAQLRGDTRVTRMLRDAGAPAKEAAGSTASPQAAAELNLNQTLELLGHTAGKSFKVTGCGSCHHNTLPLVAYAEARRAGLEVNTAVEKKMMNYLVSAMKPIGGILLEGSGVIPDLPTSAAFILEAFAAQGYAADTLTASMVHNIALQQHADGHFVGWAPRPPLENGDIEATASAIRAFRLYPVPGRREELDQRVAMAARWLRSAVPATTEDHIMRMLGLKWAGLDSQEITSSGKQLMRMQRSDGGWGQLPGLPSDAYATARAVYALREVLGATNAVIPAAVKFLRQTQLADGTWHVKTRSFPFQPMLDTDFPHGRDQWISAAATSWAVIALAQEHGARQQQARLR